MLGFGGTGDGVGIAEAPAIVIMPGFGIVAMRGMTVCGGTIGAPCDIGAVCGTGGFGVAGYGGRGGTGAGGTGERFI